VGVRISDESGGFLLRVRQLVAMIVAFALIAAGAVAAVVFTRRQGAGTPKTSVVLAPNKSVAIVDPKTNRIPDWSSDNGTILFFAWKDDVL
jgi:hypothetical protein